MCIVLYSLVKGASMKYLIERHVERICFGIINIKFCEYVQFIKEKARISFKVDKNLRENTDLRNGKPLLLGAAK